MADSVQRGVGYQEDSIQKTGEWPQSALLFIAATPGDAIVRFPRRSSSIQHTLASLQAVGICWTAPEQSGLTYTQSVIIQHKCRLLRRTEV